VYDYLLEDFYAMSLAAKPVLLEAAAAAQNPMEKHGLELALKLVMGVRGFAHEVDAARTRGHANLVDKLSVHLVRTCTPAPGHFRILRVSDSTFKVNPLVWQAREWLEQWWEQRTPAQTELFPLPIVHARSRRFTRAQVEMLRRDSEVAGLTIAPEPIRRRISDDLD